MATLFGVMIGVFVWLLGPSGSFKKDSIGWLFVCLGALTVASICAGVAAGMFYTVLANLTCGE